MFGYVLVDKPELKVREFEVYKSWYCGLCRTLKERSGFLGQMTLTYDMTFLILLLHGLYEPEETCGECRCVAHPTQKHCTRVDEFSEYAADMNLLLMYYKCMDDWNDNKKVSRLGYAKALKGKCKKIEQRYPEKAQNIADSLLELSRLEAENCQDLDRVSGCFGRLMGEILACKKDLWEKDLRELGFYLGKYIYLLDAYEDLEKDKESGSFNPLIDLCDADTFEEQIFSILEMMMAEAALRFERLPILENEQILRNILYSGVWSRYDIAKEKRKEALVNNDGKRSV